MGAREMFEKRLGDKPEFAKPEDWCIYEQGFSDGQALSEPTPNKMVEFVKWVQWERVSIGFDKKWYFKGQFTTRVFAETDAELLKKFKEHNDGLKGFFDHISF